MIAFLIGLGGLSVKTATVYRSALGALEPALGEAVPWLPGRLQGFATLAANRAGLVLAIWRLTHRRNAGEG